MQSKSVSMNDISKIVWKNLFLIIISTLIFGVIGALYAKHEKHTNYESVRSMVTGRPYNGAAANEEVQADISLGETYAKIIESDDVAKSARKTLPNSLRKKYSAQQISSAVNADPVTQTTIIKVSAQTSSAKDSAAIVNAVTAAAAKTIPQKIPSAGNISLFSKATASEAQSKTSPSTKKLAIKGAAVGFLVGIIISFTVTTWAKLIRR